MSDSHTHRSDKSLAERLRALFGASIDPRIELRGDTSSAEDPVPQQPGSPVTLKHRYTPRGELARGGMGMILKVWDQDLKRALAMKLMLGQSAASKPSPEDSLRLRRFLEEAQITGQLEHPGIVPVHEIGLDQEGRLYFTMRLIKGRDLRAILDLAAQGAEGWTQTRTLHVILKVCEAMAFAHDKSVIHRDLKPANIMVGRFGETYVMDWGLAKIVEDQKPAVAESNTDLTQSIIHTDRDELSPGLHLDTLDGDIVGTPSYMAPEQAAGRARLIGPKADIYAVGAMLYHLLTGRVPFLAPNESLSASALLQRVLEGPPPPVHQLNPHVPAELIAICEKAMAREPSSRYATMLAMAQDIQAYLEGRVVSAYQVGAVAEFKKWVHRNRGMAAALLAAMVMAGGGLLGVLWVQSSAKNQLAAKNAELELKNVALRDTNTALQAAEHEARANAEKARAGERDVRRQSYVANITAADAALESWEALRARWCLDQCDESLRGWEWYHLRGRADTSVRVIDHDLARSVVRSSADGKRLAVASATGIVRVYDTASGTVLHEVTPDSLPNIAVLTGDGRTLAIAGLDSTVQLWDVDTKQRVAILGKSTQPTAAAGIKGCVALAFDATGTLLAAGGDDRVLRLWNVTTHKLERELRHDATVQAVAIRRDGRALATGTLGNQICVWDLGSGNLELTLIGNDSSGAGQELIAGHGGVLALAYHPDGELLLSGAADSSIRLWDLTTRRTRFATREHPAPVNDVVFTPNGEHFVSASADGTVRVWRADTGDLEQTHVGHSGFVDSATIVDHGRTIITGSVDGSIRAWRLLGAEPVTHIDSSSPINSLTWSADGKQLVSGHFDGFLRMHDSITGALQRVIEVTRVSRPAPFGGVPGAELLRDGAHLVAASSETVSIWNAATFELEQENPAPNGMVNKLVSTDTPRFATSSWRGNVVIWDAESGHKVREWTIPGGLYSVAYSRDATLIATASQSRSIVVWNAETGEELIKLPQVQGETFAMNFSPDGVELLIATTAGYVQVYDANSAELLLDLTSQHDPLLSITYSPDGRRLATGGFDGAVRIWNSHTGEQLLMLRASLDSPVSSLAFSPDGKRLAAADWGGNVDIWETEPAAARVAAIDASVTATAAATSVLYPLLDQGEPGSTLARRFADDQLLRVEVKDAIVRLARLEPYAATLDEQAWLDVLHASADSNRTRAALRKAEEACRLLPGRARFERTLALAHLRLGEYHPAVSGRYARMHEESPAGLAILAMAYHALARDDRAQELITKLDASGDLDADSASLANEARTLMSGR